MRLVIKKSETKADWKNSIKRREAGRVQEARDVRVRSTGSWTKAHKSMTLDKPFNLFTSVKQI